MTSDPTLSKNDVSLSYKDAGVNIDAGNQLVERIKNTAAKTHRTGVMNGLGGFGALFELPKGYQQPVLVSGTDGVGTKVKLAIEMERHKSIGIDLVAMCVNDLIVQGAEPLFFLDYYATSALNLDHAADVIEGIGKGCELAGCALIGGETAEMPGLYQQDDYDLAGFCVGIAEKQALIDGQSIQSGDSIIALASSGPHSNGYSLIRKVIEHSNHHLDDTFGNSTLGDHFLLPTKIYVKSILTALKQHNIHGIAHITGGGLLENIPRVMPESTQAVIDTQSWELPPIFQWLQEQGRIKTLEMRRTFNCGVGMVIIAPENETTALMDCLNESGETAWKIGHIQSSDQRTPSVHFTDA